MPKISPNISKNEADTHFERTVVDAEVETRLVVVSKTLVEVVTTFPVVETGFSVVCLVVVEPDSFELVTPGWEVVSTTFFVVSSFSELVVSLLFDVLSTLPEVISTFSVVSTIFVVVIMIVEDPLVVCTGSVVPKLPGFVVSLSVTVLVLNKLVDVEVFSFVTTPVVIELSVVLLLESVVLGSVVSDFVVLLPGLALLFSTVVVVVETLVVLPSEFVVTIGLMVVTTGFEVVDSKLPVEVPVFFVVSEFSVVSAPVVISFVVDTTVELPVMTTGLVTCSVVEWFSVVSTLVEVVSNPIVVLSTLFEVVSTFFDVVKPFSVV